MKILIFLGVLYSLTAQASFPAGPTLETFQWVTKEELPAMIKAARERQGKRGVATSSLEKEMSPELLTMQKALHSAKTAEDVQNLITKLEKEIDKYPSDAKLLGSIMLAIKPLRGLVYRMIPMVKNTKTTHSYLRTAVRQMASNFKLYLPVDHSEAIFAFLTEPFETSTGVVVKQFTGSKKVSATSEFQHYLGHEFYSSYSKALKRISQIDLKTPVVWDNKMVFGPQSFRGDGLKRLRLVGEGERHLVLSSMNSGLHYLHYLLAYNLDDVFELSADVGRLYGIDGFLGGEIEGVPSYRVTKTVRKFPKAFTIREGGYVHMSQSFKHLRESVRQMRIAREEVRNMDESPLFLISPDRMNPWDENFEKQMAVAECLVEDELASCPVKSNITGETVKVNLGAFYMQPPQDLKILMPTNWDIATKEKSKFGVKYPNYHWGRPVEWNVFAYKTYFPEVNSASDVQKTVRVLRQGSGGEFFGAPLAMFVE